MHVNLFFDWLSIGELLTFKTGPPCITIEKDLLWSMSKEISLLHYFCSSIRYRVCCVLGCYYIFYMKGIVVKMTVYETAIIAIEYKTMYNLTFHSSIGRFKEAHGKNRWAVSSRAVSSGRCSAAARQQPEAARLCSSGPLRFRNSPKLRGMVCTPMATTNVNCTPSPSCKSCRDWSRFFPSIDSLRVDPVEVLFWFRIGKCRHDSHP